MKSVTLAIAFALLTIPQAFSEAHKFKYFSLNGELNEKVKILEQVKTGKLPEDQGVMALRRSAHKFRMKKLGIDFKQIQKELKNKAAVTYLKTSAAVKRNDFFETPLFREIAGYLTGNQNDIGNDEARSVISHREKFDLGKQNYSGFSWQKPFGAFGIAVNRQITPDLFHKTRYIVSDTFEITIDAATYLSFMKEEGMINIGNSEIGIFVGLTFKRKYRYEHFANTYVEGLFSDFSKLFMSFTRFRKEIVLELGPYEYLKKEDFFAIKVGAMATFPPIYFIQMGIGVLVGYEQVASVELQSLGPSDRKKNGEFLRLNAEKSKTFTTGVSAEIKLDFMEILKLDIFSLDFTYDLTKTQSVHLSFYEEDKEKLRKAGKAQDEFYNLLRMRITSVQELTSNVVTLEERKKENLDLTYNIFTFAQSIKKDTEHYRFKDKEGDERIFYKHYFSDDKLVQNFWGKLLSGFLSGLLNIPYTPQVMAYLKRKAILEYEFNDQQNLKENDFYIQGEEKMSISLTRSLYVKKTKGFASGGYRKYAIKQMQRYSNLPQKIIDAVKNKKLIGPLSIKSTTRVMKSGLEHLHRMDVNLAFLQFAKICRSHRANKWMKSRFRELFMRRWQVGRELCTQNMGRVYLRFREEYDKYGDIAFKRFKKLLMKIQNRSQSIDDYRKLFGSENIFYNGQMRAKTDKGAPFITFFADGNFEGTGVINKFIEINGMPRSHTPVD